MNSASRRSPSRLPLAILWLTILLAAVLRFFRIGYQSLWADEGNSVAMAGRTLAEISAAAAADIHPPLYYWLLNLWVRIFGDSEIAVRALSALFGILLVWLTYQIAVRLFDRRTALIATFFVAINPFLIYYSQEARMYEMLAALTALLYYGLVRFILHESIVLPADGTGKTVSFSGLATGIVVFASIAGLYTHYTFLAIVGLVTMLYLLWVANSRRRGFVKIRLLHWGLLLIVIAFFYLPWIRTAFSQLTSWPRTGVSVPLEDALSRILILLSLGPVTPVKPGSPWLTTFLLLFILGLWPWIRPNGRRAHWLSWLLPLLAILVPIVMVLAGGLYKESYLKFLVVSAAPFTILMGRGVTGFMEALEKAAWKRPASANKPPAKQAGNKKNGSARPQAGKSTRSASDSTGRWLALVWLVIAVVLVSIPTAQTLVTYYFDPAVARDNYRGMASYIAAIGRPDDAIILNAPGQREVFEYYYDGSLPIYGLPEQRPPDEQATTEQLETIASRHPHLYGLLWATDESDPQHIVEGWLDTHAYKATDTWQGNVRFVTYATQQDSDAWPRQESNISLDDQIRLATYALSSQEVESGEVLQIQLAWQAEQVPATDYTVFVQLLDQRNQVVAQHDAPPLSGERPTSGWQPDEIVVDNRGVLVPYGTAPGDYQLIVGMYDPSTGQRLTTDYADYIDLGTVRVNRPAVPPSPVALNMQNSESFAFDEITLLGHDRYKRGFKHDPSTPLRAGDLLHLTFYWRADVKPTAAWWFTARLVQGADKEAAAVSGPLVSDLYPTLNWEQGEVVRGEHDMQIPDYVEPGRYQLQLFLHTGNPTDTIDRVILGNVTVSE